VLTGQGTTHQEQDCSVILQDGHKAKTVSSRAVKATRSGNHSAVHHLLSASFQKRLQHNQGRLVLPMAIIIAECEVFVQFRLDSILRVWRNQLGRLPRLALWRHASPLRSKVLREERPLLAFFNTLAILHFDAFVLEYRG
jgi:hypothetical protein